MGWTSYHLERGQAKNEFVRMLTWETETAKNEFVQGAFTSFNEFYAAVKTTIKATGQSYTWAFAAMIRWDRSYHNFCYKDMDETVGPNIANCPVSILALLTPTEEIVKLSGHGSTYAKAWRIRCWENAFAKKNFKHGDIVKFPANITFTNGEERSLFFVEKVGRRTRYKAYDAVRKTAFGYYKLPSNIVRQMELVPA